VQKHFSDRSAAQDVAIDKLRLKNTTLKNGIYKVESQLDHKDEVGDVLHYIDFHSLQIENKQFTAKIEERNDEFLMVKLSTGKTTKCLNELNSKLSERSAELQALKTEIIDKKSQLHELETENHGVRGHIRADMKFKSRLTQTVEDAKEMPAVEDYILQKREMYELESDIRQWNKKIDILEMAAAQSRRTSKLSSSTEF
jgi:chromosome segregation ATPase